MDAGSQGCELLPRLASMLPRSFQCVAFAKHVYMNLIKLILSNIVVMEPSTILQRWWLFQSSTSVEVPTVSTYTWCDGVIDCPQGDDEYYCKGVFCPPGYLKCKGSKICVNQNHICDGEVNCMFYGEDELQCFKRTTMSSVAYAQWQMYIVWEPTYEEGT